MGPRVTLSSDGTPDWSRLTLRPFVTSRTCGNLLRDRCGVFHVTDDVRLLAVAAVRHDFPLPPLVPATEIAGFALADCCRYLEFMIDEIDDSTDRVTMTALVVRSVRVRDFFGLNRAKAAVVEAAILATRTHLLPAADIASEFARLRPAVDKTGGPAEHEAFNLLEQFIAEASAG